MIADRGPRAERGMQVMAVLRVGAAVDYFLWEVKGSERLRR